MAKTPTCQKCGDSGWKPHYDANGERVWLPLMNDALPCECGALARNYAAQKAALGVSAPIPHPLPAQANDGGEHG